MNRHALAREEYRRQLRVEVARELHDGPVRELTGAIARLQGFRTASEHPAMQAAISAIEEHARASLASLRRIMADLREEPPEENLPSMVGSLVQRYRESFGIRFEVVVSPTWPLRLPPDHALNLLRVIQEAISNAIRHGGPEHVLVEMRAAEGELRLEVHDDGAGIAPEALRHPGTGIRGMRERAALLGGRLSIARRERGTRVTLTLRRPPGS